MNWSPSHDLFEKITNKIRDTGRNKADNKGFRPRPQPMYWRPTAPQGADQEKGERRHCNGDNDAGVHTERKWGHGQKSTSHERKKSHQARGER